ncbi:NAD(P)/FAD-dependent oxidoreductase [Patescibacteria group bacterium]|nr:NAD(P)/FAD-dependent oxidoreductase [Patescibacteria group bacterium]MBU4458637.1 NAD(P)/FAD-dependent oxidoreductase [Patescibacteria group bacterium]MCG2695996.1 NAD(P)/FAD-dependent oxidoreductase [Candidatus Portnoybacteria bacterium]
MEYDVAVIGGGPTGMISAGRAGELGASVILIEKNKNLGRKLLITGKGRCNITNKENNPREFINKFGKNGKFLFSSFSIFGIQETINFFEKLNLKTKIERGRRVFPVSDKSQDVLEALIGYLKKSNVKIKLNSEVKEIIKKDNKIEKIILTNNEEIIASKFIISTGGKSYPGTGSTGDGYKWAKKLGHIVTNLSSSLVPIIVKEKIVKELEGLSLKNVEISVYEENKKIDSRFGEAIFTADGMSGPIIIDMSKKIGQELPKNIKIKIDFKPALDFSKLDQRIREDFSKDSKKMFKNSLNDLLPQKLIPVIVKLSKINPNKKSSSITREERKKLLYLLKKFTLEVKSLAVHEKAIITSGGIELSEVDQKTMKSKLIDNLYFAGEILDVDGPTGGYNLQVCWTTGYIAGENTAPVARP